MRTALKGDNVHGYTRHIRDRVAQSPGRRLILSTSM